MSIYDRWQCFHSLKPYTPMSSYDKQSTTCQQLKSDTAMTIYGKQDTKVSNIKHHPAMTVNGKQNTTYHNRRSHNIMSISCRKIKACQNLNPNIACRNNSKIQSKNHRGKWDIFLYDNPSWMSCQNWGPDNCPSVIRHIFHTYLSSKGGHSI